MPALRKSLGLTGLSFYSIGIIIGAGIYSIIGAASAEAGTQLWLSFILAAIVAGLTGLSYAELASTFPKAGAEFIYAKKAFPQLPILHSLTGFILTVAASATACTVALSFSGYLNSFFEVSHTLSAFLLLTLCTLINLKGIKEASWINVVFTLIEILGLVFVIWIAFRETEPLTAFLNPQLHKGVFTGASLIFFVYLGFEDIANVAEETKNPGRNIPLAILISLSITTLLYVLVALSVMSLSSAKELSESSYPLITAIQNHSPKLLRLMGAIALFSTANTVLISLIAASRMLYGMANENAMPRILARVSRKTQAPWTASIAVFFIAICFLPFNKISIIANLSSSASLLAFAIVNICLIVLRFKKPGIERPFKVPISIGRLPLPPIFALITIAGLGLFFESEIYISLFAALVIGSLLYLTLGKIKLRLP
ncbi:MAG: APC family permease [Bdellovibrionota bacterium]